MQPETGIMMLELEQEIDASARAVYEALTEPAQLARWFTTAAQADLRVGGRYSNADGDKGEFVALEFTWENEAHCPGTLVDVRLESGPSGSVGVRLVHSRLKSEADVEDMRTGWSWALASLKSYLETGTPVSFETWIERTAGSEGN